MGDALTQLSKDFDAILKKKQEEKIKRKEAERSKIKSLQQQVEEKKIKDLEAKEKKGSISSDGDETDEVYDAIEDIINKFDSDNSDMR